METEERELGPIGYLAKTVGGTEPALRLLISVLLAYPLAYLHQKKIHEYSPSLQHLYFLSCGITVFYFNFGLDVVHFIICIFFTYILLEVAGGTLKSVIISFVFMMGYLLAAYFYTATKEYDIKWSTPQCVLTLRLIGLVFDVYDGHKPVEQLSEEQKKSALTYVPSLLAISGYSFFFGGFLVGPQFPMKRYDNFVTGNVELAKDKTASRESAAMQRMGLGLMYLIINQVGSTIFYETYPISESFQESGCIAKIFGLAIWAKITLYKYVSIWLLSEGSCILTGLAYNGKDENGNDKWDGCSNIRVYKYETTCSFSGLIKSFNINTNLWVAQYVFKRLKFMNNKNISQAASLLFLAVWHGMHSGYYICFANEFIVMKLEHDVQAILDRKPKFKSFLESPLMKIPVYIMLKIYVAFGFAYCIVPFILLSHLKWFAAYSNVYFCCHIVWLSWPLVHFGLLTVFKSLRPPRRPAKKEQ